MKDNAAFSVRQKHAWLTKMKNFGEGGVFCFISFKNFHKPLPLQRASPSASLGFSRFGLRTTPGPSWRRSISQGLLSRLGAAEAGGGPWLGCLAARGTGCSHGGQQRGSPGATLGPCPEELFVQERDRQLQRGLVWSELSQS